MKTMKLILLMSLAIAVGCASNMNNGMQIGTEENVGDRTPTLLVVNTGIDVIRIYEGSRRIGTVYPARSECIILRNHQIMRQLSFGYLASSGRWYAAQKEFNDGEGWVWNINSNLPNFSEIDIYPSERCK